MAGFRRRPLRRDFYFCRDRLLAARQHRGVWFDRPSLLVAGFREPGEF